jgi:hypothetical protein
MVMLKAEFVLFVTVRLSSLQSISASTDSQKLRHVGAPSSSLSQLAGASLMYIKESKSLSLRLTQISLDCSAVNSKTVSGRNASKLELQAPA